MFSGSPSSGTLSALLMMAQRPNSCPGLECQPNGRCHFLTHTHTHARAHARALAHIPGWTTDVAERPVESWLADIPCVWSSSASPYEGTHHHQICSWTLHSRSAPSTSSNHWQSLEIDVFVEKLKNTLSKTIRCSVSSAETATLAQAWRILTPTKHVQKTLSRFV